jgi:hypothetical protein
MKKLTQLLVSILFKVLSMMKTKIMSTNCTTRHQIHYPCLVTWKRDHLSITWISMIEFIKAQEESRVVKMLFFLTTSSMESLVELKPKISIKTWLRLKSIKQMKKGKFIIPSCMKISWKESSNLWIKMSAKKALEKPLVKKELRSFNKSCKKSLRRNIMVTERLRMFLDW